TGRPRGRLGHHLPRVVGEPRRPGHARDRSRPRRQRGRGAPVTRAYAGLVLLNLAYLAAGYALLYGIGFARSGRSAVRSVGLALCRGWALVGVALATAVALGRDPDAVALIVVVLALAAGGIAMRGRFPSVELVPMPRDGALVRRLAALAGLVL